MFLWQFIFSQYIKKSETLKYLIKKYYILRLSVHWSEFNSCIKKAIICVYSLIQ